MKSPAVYTKSGAKATAKATLNKAVFDNIPEKHDLLQQAYVTYLANGRVGSAKTKLRGEVRGGGRKPWRQKGTGRARAGSIRSPLWRGGGITFGPTGNESHSKKMHLTARRTALKQALSLALDAGSVSIIEDISLKDGKTKEAAALLQKIGAERKTLIITHEKDELVRRATNNLPDVSYVAARHVSVFDVLNADTIVLTRAGLTSLEERLSGGEK